MLSKIEAWVAAAQPHIFSLSGVEPPHAPVGVHVVERIEGRGYLGGATHPGWIEISRHGDDRPFTAAHELTHFWLQGTVWTQLPAIVEEGVCDLIALQAQPNRRPEWLARHAVLAANTVADALSLELSTYTANEEGTIRMAVDVE